MPLLTEVIGFAAATVGSVIMLPQVIKTLRTRKADDLSLIMIILLIVNCVLWISYGTLILSWPVIVCNSIALVVISLQLVLKIRYSAR